MTNDFLFMNTRLHSLKERIHGGFFINLLLSFLLSSLKQSNGLVGCCADLTLHRRPGRCSERNNSMLKFKSFRWQLMDFVGSKEF